MSFPEEPQTPPLSEAPPPPAAAGRGLSGHPALAGVAVAVAAAVMGAAITHFAWSDGSSTPSVGGASAVAPRVGGTFRPPSQSPSGGLFGGSLPPSSSSGGSSAPSGSVDATAAKVDPGLVDINTKLGNQGAAAGTGMVVSQSGTVITNNHVISGATSITATDIGNGRTYKARVVGYDQTHDVAVIQLIGASNLQTVTLGDSSTVHVGQSVVTVGNAGGAGGTPSAAAGTVTALGQSITTSGELDSSSEHLAGLIALDGSLQPGDSGGPLVNSSGEVVGMDTAASAGFGFQSSSGQDFAVPINQVVSLAKKIVAGQSTNTIHIGATALIGVEVGSNARLGFGGSSSSQGAYVAGVVNGTSAAAAGIAEGDTITEFGGHTVTSAAALTQAKSRLHPGERVTVTWVDGSNATHTATLTLTSGPAG